MDELNENLFYQADDFSQAENKTDFNKLFII